MEQVEVDASALELFTVEEVRKKLRVSRDTVFKEIKRGRLASVRVGRSRRVPPSAVAAYIELLNAEAQQEAAARQGAA